MLLYMYVIVDLLLYYVMYTVRRKIKILTYILQGQAINECYIKDGQMLSSVTQK